jgi:putative nucleotidyltransferase with HDIG domain
MTNLLDIVVRISACIVGGCLSAFLAAGLTPVVEYLGGYASDMRLIEMATLDHPLLKELSIQAPGTWNHSMVMGMMVESAADAIGANSVVCRVGAYFHDVGKMKKPLYFVENQAPGENRHDKLSPSMSALIIRSHVKDGVELARKHKVPQVIEDMIPQHHGTSLIEYFYEKAKKDVEEAGEDNDSVDKGLYSYPGPRPQTREAGLLMLADGIEAAARTLPDPTADRIQGMVQKMINKVFSSGELNECELTLRDLHLIAKCFTRVLSGIYHQRIAYAEPAEKVNESDMAEDGTEREASGRGESTRKPRAEENLKRLGLE